MSRTLNDLTLDGIDQCFKFCDKNKIRKPTIVRVEKDSPYYRLNTCAFYRGYQTLRSEQAETIWIMVDKCAQIGTSGRQWSYPGYAVDRTPYGVISHELGHHVDYLKSREMKETKCEYSFSSRIRENANETPLTGYCPDNADHEWFAEMMRLFITNPDLLKNIKPKTYHQIVRFFEPCETRMWTSVLKNAPQRTIDAARQKFKKD